IGLRPLRFRSRVGRPGSFKDFFHRMALPLGVGLKTERAEHGRPRIQNRHRLLDRMPRFDPGPPGAHETGRPAAATAPAPPPPITRIGHGRLIARPALRPAPQAIQRTCGAPAPSAPGFAAPLLIAGLAAPLRAVTITVVCFRIPNSRYKSRMEPTARSTVRSASR